MIGKTLSHYKIIEQLGKGGMGEVYLADDTTLDRKVALKFLPEAFTSDPERMARFEREAKLLASLNHPNIAGIHGLEQADGNRFLVLEYVEGETLQAKLSRGALPLEDALELCRQIAEGLETAHEKGVIHRDLKPANVMITAEEKVKILDFGLAKAFSDETQSIDSSQSPTLTEAMTRPGVILGTAAYMSPEQAKGKRVDKRADIWAFGCILYECLTGKRAFEADSVTETLSFVLTREPELDKVPARFHAVLRMCMEKNLQKRLRDIIDTMTLLESTPEIAPAYQPGKQSKILMIWSVAAALLVVGMAIPAFLYFSDREQKDVVRFSVDIAASDMYSLSVSPDGRHIAYVENIDGRRMLSLRSLDKLESRVLQGTNGALYPFWSPNSQSIGFGADGIVKRIGVSGGYPEELCNIPNDQLFRGGTWSSRDVIVFASAEGPIYQIPATGGKPAAVTEIDDTRQESTHRHPFFLPDGRHFLFTVRSQSPENHGIFIGSIDSNGREKVSGVHSNAVFAAPDILLYAKDGNLIAQHFDPDTLKAAEDFIPIVPKFGDPVVGFAPFSASGTRLIAFMEADNILTNPLIWRDRDGKQVGEIGLSGYDPALSPDNARIAAMVYQIQDSTTDIWMKNLSGGISDPITDNSAWDQHPRWSTDGTRIVYYSIQKDENKIFMKQVDGSRSEEEIHSSDSFIRPTDWSPGDLIVFRIDDPETGMDLWALPLSGDRKPFPIANSEYDEAQGVVSPDGGWIAFSSNQPGQSDIYVQTFSSPGQTRKVTENGGSDPKWSADGTELFYIAPDGKLMSIPVKRGERLSFGRPTALFDTKIIDYNREGSNYDVSVDGRRFVLPQVSLPTQFNVILNWTKLLEQ